MFICEKNTTENAQLRFALMRKNDDEKADFIDVRVACVGNVDGKLLRLILEIPKLQTSVKKWLLD